MMCKTYGCGLYSPTVPMMNLYTIGTTSPDAHSVLFASDNSVFIYDSYIVLPCDSW